jgi:hypothetical protein
MQLLGDEPANGRFARAHEADEREIDVLARVAHANQFTDFPAQRTFQISPPRHSANSD